MAVKELVGVNVNHLYVDLLKLSKIETLGVMLGQHRRRTGRAVREAGNCDVTAAAADDL